MASNQTDDVKFLIGNLFEKHPDASVHFILNQLKGVKVSKDTVYRVKNRLKNKISLIRKVGSGRKRRKLSPRSKRKLRMMCDRKVALSWRSLARKFNRSDKTIKKDVIDLGIMKKRRILAPKCDEKQMKRQRVRLNKARKGCLRALNGLMVVMDDEAYYPYKRDYSKHYFTSGKKEVPRDVKYRTKEKFPKKLLVWLAISENGHSEPFFMLTRGNVTKEIYVEECIKQRLVPFIQNHHPNGDIIFWPDLASAHYAKFSLETLESLGIPFVPKEENPPGLPQLRPIEDFWATHKDLVYEGGWEAKNDKDLIKRINDRLKCFNQEYFANLMCKVKTKLRRAAEDGPDTLIH